MHLRRVPKWVLILSFVGFICIVLSVGLLAKYKFRSAPVYVTAPDTKYVNQEEINRNVQSGTIVVIQPGEKALLPGAKWVPQSFNNCAPATTSMVLQYFGHTVDQNTTKARLRTNSDDKNVFTYEIQQYLKQDFNIDSKLLYNGNLQMLKTLVANGFYVVVEDWLHPNEDIGHVTIIRGFDDAQGVFIADDSFIGTNIVHRYEEFDTTQWKAFNREYTPVYTIDKEPLLQAIIGENWEEQVMYQKAVERNTFDTTSNPTDMYAWFNLGTSYFGLGKYQEARDAFEKSQAIGWPKRMLWYQIQPIQTYNMLGEYEKAIALANIALVGNDSFAEAHVEKAIAYNGLNDSVKASTEIEKALFYSPNLQTAKDIQATL